MSIAGLRYTISWGLCVYEIVTDHDVNKANTIRFYPDFFNISTISHNMHKQMTSTGSSLHLHLVLATAILVSKSRSSSCALR
jgi:hypothetical protein